MGLIETTELSRRITLGYLTLCLNPTIVGRETKCGVIKIIVQGNNMSMREQLSLKPMILHISN